MSDSSDVLCHLDSGIRLRVAFIIDFIQKKAYLSSCEYLIFAHNWNIIC